MGSEAGVMSVGLCKDFVNEKRLKGIGHELQCLESERYFLS